MMYEGHGYIRTSEIEREARMLRAEAIADLIVKAVRWVQARLGHRRAADALARA